MQDFNIAVIGAGYWGRKHVDELSKSTVARLSAVADPSEASRKFCEEKYGVATFADYREMLADQKISAVSICTNNELHFQVAKDALEAGKHVLVEKPLTTDAITSQQLISIAKGRGLVLCVGHLFRFNNAVMKLRQLFREGFFGKPYFMKIEWTNHNGPVPGRSILMDLGPHAFDIPHFITGWWPKKSIYFGSHFRRGELEETTFLESDFGNGFYMYGELSWLVPGKKRQVLIAGEKGYAWADCASQKALAQEVKIPSGPLCGAQKQAAAKKPSDGELANLAGMLGEPYDLGVKPNNALAEELESFVLDCKGKGARESENSGEIGLRALEALLACRKAR